MSEEDLEDRVEALEERVNRLEGRESTRKYDTGNKKTSINEFVREFDPTVHREKVMVIGYYLEHYDGDESFTVQDIRDGYRKCKWKPPTNPSDIINQTIERGHLMEVGTDEEGNRQHVLTQSGEAAVEDMKGD